MFSDIYSTIQHRLGDSSPARLKEIKKAINAKYYSILSDCDWEFAKKWISLDTIAPYSTGTVTATHDSKTVSGDFAGLGRYTGTYETPPNTWTITINGVDYIGTIPVTSSSVVVLNEDYLTNNVGIPFIFKINGKVHTPVSALCVTYAGSPNIGVPVNSCKSIWDSFVVPVTSPIPGLLGGTSLNWKDFPFANNILNTPAVIFSIYNSVDSATKVAYTVSGALALNAGTFVSAYSGTTGYKTYTATIAGVAYTLGYIYVTNTSTSFTLTDSLNAHSDTGGLQEVYDWQLLMAITSQRVKLVIDNDGIGYPCTISGNHTLTLDNSYQGATGSGKTYKLYKDVYRLDDRVKHIYGAFTNASGNFRSGRLEEIRGRKFLDFDPNNIDAGAPQGYILDGEVQVPYYNTGYVILSNGSKTVSANGSKFSSEMAGMVFVPFGDGNEYIIDTIVSVTQLTLKQAYAGSSASACTFEIGSEFCEQIRIWPMSDDVYGVKAWVKLRPVPLLADTDEPLIPPDWVYVLTEKGWQGSLAGKTINRLDYEQSVKESEEGLALMREEDEISKDLSASILDNPDDTKNFPFLTKEGMDPLGRYS